VELKRFTDQIHGFFNIVGVGRTSRAAVLEIAGRLRAALT
jgi:acetyl esterase